VEICAHIGVMSALTATRCVSSAEMTQIEFFVARYITSAGLILSGEHIFSFGSLCQHEQPRLSSLHSSVTNHSKVDLADQIRSARLGGAHGGHRLLQRTDVRSERHDSA
jgi:hypothetical protein